MTLSLLLDSPKILGRDAETLETLDQGLVSVQPQPQIHIPVLFSRRCRAALTRAGGRCLAFRAGLLVEVGAQALELGMVAAAVDPVVQGEGLGDAAGAGQVANPL